MIGKLVVTLLRSNASLMALVPEDNIYPYVMNEDTPLPAIVYTIDSIAPEYTKDGWVGDEIAFSVISFSDNYGSLQDIAAEVRDSLELEEGITEGITIRRIYCTGQNEGYNIAENVFLNRLTFSTVVIKF